MNASEHYYTRVCLLVASGAVHLRMEAGGEWRDNPEERDESSRPIRIGRRIVRPAPYDLVSGTARAKRLRLAVTTNNVQLVKRMLERGSNANEADEHRRSLLHLASCQGYAEIVKLLIAYGADPNKRDGLGNTPLHLAACTHHIPVVVELLNAGTDTSSLNEHGKSPIQLAQSKLKLIRLRPHANPEDTERLKAEIATVVDMMLEYLRLRKSETSEMEALRRRLEKIDTKEQVDNEISLLLENLDDLSLTR